MSQYTPHDLSKIIYHVKETQQLAHEQERLESEKACNWFVSELETFIETAQEQWIKDNAPHNPRNLSKIIYRVKEAKIEATEQGRVEYAYACNWFVLQLEYFIELALRGKLDRLEMKPIPTKSGNTAKKAKKPFQQPQRKQPFRYLWNKQMQRMEPNPEFAKWIIEHPEDEWKEYKQR